VKTYEYDKKLGYQIKKCEVCEHRKSCCQHHLEAGSGRSTSKVIWVCDEDHAKIHNPTAYGLDARWSYDNGYLVRHNSNYKKEVKKKKCSHSVTYYNTQLKDFVCQFCGKRVGKLKKGKNKN